MSALDWAVLLGTNGLIIGFGIHRAHRIRSGRGYLSGKGTLPWYTVGLSVMATQASAITFLSVPGQAFESGMGFVQFYFGLPIAMIVVAFVFLPRYASQKVITAYAYLESKFDVRVRVLGAFLFLIQRGLAAGITIYAPAIVLSSMAGWPLHLTCIGIGGAVILYTTFGGTHIVSQTQQQQMIVILSGIAIAFGVLVHRISDHASFLQAIDLATVLGKMNVVSTKFDLSTRYNLWSGLLGGFFLALAYFGTDQSQVQRYMSANSVKHSRWGLLFNGAFKIPMQFGILLLGVMLFVFYLFEPGPLSFNGAALQQAKRSPVAQQLKPIEARFNAAQEHRKQAATRWLSAETPSQKTTAEQELKRANHRVTELRQRAKVTMLRESPGSNYAESDFVFLAFILNHLPMGLVGLLIAVVLSAAMSSTASELNALGTTTAIDLYQRLQRKQGEPSLGLSRGLTAAWGLLALTFALTASLFDNLIEAVNILGSLFYGATLGLFLTAFFIKRATPNIALISVTVAQLTVFALFAFSTLGYLWFNLIGCLTTLTIATLLGHMKASTPAK